MLCSLNNVIKQGSHDLGYRASYNIDYKLYLSKNYIQKQDKLITVYVFTTAQQFHVCGTTDAARNRAWMKQFVPDESVHQLPWSRNV